MSLWPLIQSYSYKIQQFINYYEKISKWTKFFGNLSTTDSSHMEKWGRYANFVWSGSFLRLAASGVTDRKKKLDMVQPVCLPNFRSLSFSFRLGVGQNTKNIRANVEVSPTGCAFHADLITISEITFFALLLFLTLNWFIFIYIYTGGFLARQA